MRYLTMLCLVALAGCCHAPTNTVGWRFEMGKPGLAYSPAVVSATAPVYGVAPLAAYPAVPAGVPVGPRRMAAPLPPVEPCDEPLPPPRRMSAAGQECTLQMVCDKLDVIARRLDSGPLPKKLP